MSAQMLTYTHQIVVYSVVSFVVHLILTMIVIVMLIQTKDCMKELASLHDQCEQMKAALEEKAGEYSSLQKQIKEKQIEFINLQNKYVSQKRIYERYLNQKLEEIESDGKEESGEADNGQGSLSEQTGE